MDTVWLRRWLRVLIPLHTSPKRIALGVAIGLLIAFTPTIGFQMGLALVAASIFNASRVAAVLCVWVTNPMTMGPIYALTYAVGRPFWFTSPDIGLTELSQTIGWGHHLFNVAALFSGFQNISGLGSQVVGPMLVGGLIIGSVVGGLSYLPVKTAASMVHKHRRRQTRRARRGVTEVKVARSRDTGGSSAGREASLRSRSRRAA